MENQTIEVMRDLSGYFKEGQIRKIYYACDKWRDRLLIRLLWKTGRRISEILELKVSDIDFTEGRILWNILKKKKPYKTWKPIDSKTLQLLGWYINEVGLQEDHFVLNAGDPYKHISRQRAFQIVRRASKKAGIKKVGEKKPHPHHFRHSLAVDMAKKMKSPADVRKLQKYLEHSNLAVTEVYLQFGDEEIRGLLED